MYKDIRTASKALKAIMTKQGETKGTLKDYDRLIVCSLIGKFSPMYTTKLYINHSPEYCEALCYVEDISNDMYPLAYVDKYMDVEMLRAYFTIGSKVSAYGGTIDTVIEFRTNVPLWGWEVVVVGEDGNVRYHSTCPSQVKDLLKRKELNE